MENEEFKEDIVRIFKNIDFRLDQIGFGRIPGAGADDRGALEYIGERL